MKTGFKNFLTKPWLSALAGLTINISAAWFVVPFIGVNVSLPNEIWDIFVLFGNITFGIIFLLIAVSLEKRLRR